MKNYRLLLRLKDYDNGIVHIYGMRTHNGYHIRLIGEYGDMEELDCNNLRAGVDSICYAYFGVNIDYMSRRAK
jgi:hypothetical protein